MLLWQTRKCNLISFNHNFICISVVLLCLKTEWVAPFCTRCSSKKWFSPLQAPSNESLPEALQGKVRPNVIPIHCKAKVWLTSRLCVYSIHKQADCLWDSCCKSITFEFNLLFTASGGWSQDRRDTLFWHRQWFPSSVLPILWQTVAPHVPAAPGGRSVY